MKKHYLKFCPEHYTEIENYELAKADNFKGWICHHRNGEYFPRDWLIKNNMYWNRKDPHEFKFMTRADHAKLHNKGENNPMHGKSRKGVNSPNYGKHYSEESCKKMSASIKAWWAKRKQGGNYDAKMG